MKLVFAGLVVLVIASASFTQSGRRNKPVATPSPSPELPATEKTPTKPEPEIPLVTAEKNADYRCTTDGTLAHLLDSDSVDDKAFSPKEVDVKAVILAKPEPKYTRTAREAGVEGYVVLKALLSAKGDIDRVRVVRRLPYGLTENGIQAACRVKFKPALKNGAPVPMWLTLEYSFRLANSSIFGP